MRCCCVRSPTPSRSRIVAVWSRHPQKGQEQERVTLADFADWRARSHSFAEMGYSFLWPGSRATIAKFSSPLSVRSAMVSSGWLRALGVRPVQGRIFIAAEDRRGATLVALIGDQFWERQFGRDPSVIGAHPNDRQPHCEELRDRGSHAAGPAIPARDRGMAVAWSRAIRAASTWGRAALLRMAGGDRAVASRHYGGTGAEGTERHPGFAPGGSRSDGRESGGRGDTAGTPTHDGF